jgi:hypothetical protein
VTGYTGTPLPKKLGIRAGHRVAFTNEPPEFRDALGELPDGVDVRTRARGPLDVVVAFQARRSELEARIERLLANIERDGAIWIAWPKRSSAVETDITEDVVRDVALPLGLVDNKVCAIDATWSGLRLVIRLENR